MVTDIIPENHVVRVVNNAIVRIRRFLLRGLEKVKTEWGLICIAHNMAKMATILGA